MRFNNYLSIAAKQASTKPFITTKKESITYAELEKKALGLANALIDQGVEQGDRVVVILENSIESVISIFAVWYAGATVSVLNPTTKRDKLGFVFNHCSAKCVITHNKLLTEVRPAIENAHSVSVTIVHQLDDAQNTSYIDFYQVLVKTSTAIKQGISADLAMIIYTSGSTGTPKGVMMTHDNVRAAAESVSEYLEMTEQDIILNCLPLSFDYGLYQVLMTVMCQCTLVLEKSFVFPAPVIRLIREKKITGFPLVPTMAAILLQMNSLKPEDFESLRFITNTAAALSAEQIKKLQQTFPATKIFSMFGLTESKRCTYLPPEELLNRPTSVGKAIPNTEAYIIDDKGERVGANTVGQLVIRGSHVMKGYWKNAEATEKRLKVGEYPWEKELHTGDFFRSDEEGFLYFVGRMDDMIKSRGEKVSPMELELVLANLDGASEVAIIGVPDDIFGTAIKAYIVPIKGIDITQDDVLNYASNKVENYMIPKYVEIVGSLPKTNNGKIDKKLLSTKK